MKKLRRSALWGAALAVLLAVFICVSAPRALATEANEGEDQTGDSLPVLQGLTEVDGKIFFYNDDGSLFTDGYKAVETDGQVSFYYFQEDGAAFTEG